MLLIDMNLYMEIVALYRVYTDLIYCNYLAEKLMSKGGKMSEKYRRPGKQIPMWLYFHASYVFVIF